MKFQEKSPEERALAHWNATDRNWNFRRRMTMAHVKLLRISETTVKFHVGHIFKKLHVSSRQELSAKSVPHLRVA